MKTYRTFLFMIGCLAILLIPLSVGASEPRTRQLAVLPGGVTVDYYPAHTKYLDGYIAAGLRLRNKDGSMHAAAHLPANVCLKGDVGILTMAFDDGDVIERPVSITGTGLSDWEQIAQRMCIIMNRALRGGSL